jgi:hypothetical protein
MFQGSAKAGKDVEMQILKAFQVPGVLMFIKKPIAMGLEGEIKNCFDN